MEVNHRSSARFTLPASQKPSPLGQTSGFFTLSAELRNNIYHLLGLEHHDALWVLANHRSIAHDIGPTPIPPPIARVCRFVRAETLSIFYGANVFSISIMRETNVRMAKEWIEAIGDEGIVRMRKLRLRGYAWGESWYGNTDISLLVSVEHGASDRCDSALPAIFSVVPKMEHPNERVVTVAQKVTEASINPNRTRDDRAPVQRLECMIEVFASFCTFRTERPPRPPELDGAMWR